MCDLFFRIFTHLLPDAKAWRLTADKTLRQFFEGLTCIGADVREFIDLIFLDIFPDTTRALTEWEGQFALQDSGLTETERRDRLAAAWQALGGQSPAYIQETLQANGFDVYVHEWWDPASRPAPGGVYPEACVSPRDPRLYLRRESSMSSFLVTCGEAIAECGEAEAQCGNSLEPIGYPLVNRITRTIEDSLVLCGEAVAESGEEAAQCGNYVSFKEGLISYSIPLDSTKWPYFLYIGGETFGDLAKVLGTRRTEFENLCLKIAPCQQWLGIMVEYN